jgi:hypothetical protein
MFGECQPPPACRQAGKPPALLGCMLVSARNIYRFNASMIFSTFSIAFSTLSSFFSISSGDPMKYLGSL